MIIWTGWGIISLVLLVIGLLMGEQHIGGTYGDAIGVLIAAGINFGIARKVNNPEKDRILIDENTGERVAIKNRSTLFWIPMEWWSGIMILLAVVNLAS